METKIINLLNIKKNISMNYDEIKKELDLSKEDLEEALSNLEKYGTIYQSKNGRYSLVSRTSLKKGIVKVTSRKKVIVELEDGDFDLIFDKKNIVKNNDIVLVDPHYNSNRATVVKILTKEKVQDYIGTIVREGNHQVIRSESHKDIILRKEYPEGVNVLVNGETNEIKEILEDRYKIKVKELLVKNGFPTSYSTEYLKELEDIPNSLSEEEINKAKQEGVFDLRDIPHVTIDSEDTKDFDDAVAWNGMLYSSIENVPEHVKEGSLIEKDAIERGISVYPPGMVNPMLHHKLSNGICSLNPGVDRFASSIIFKIDDKYNIKPYVMGRSIIRSRAKLTYEKVNEYLEEGRVPEGYEAYTEMLEKLYNIAMKVKKNLLENGFLMFSSTEVKFIFENEKVTNIKGRHQGKAEELIEFIMLLHNMTKTDYMIKHNLPFIARNHDLPNNDKLNAWVKLLSQRGYKVDKKDSYTNEDIKQILSTYRGNADQLVLDNLAIRSQSKARYSHMNKGHFALGLKAYATFTSPIRRLSDYINERIYQDSVLYGDKYAIEKWEPKMEELAKICTDSELRADKVERKADNLKKLEYMNTVSVGSKYTATISKVGKGYIEVLLPNMVYGKVYISARDYSVSKDGYSLFNNINGERILVGDQIDVSLLKVDMDKEEVLLLRSSYSKENNYEEKKGKKKVKKR